MYMTQANEANTAIRELNNQAYMARYIRNYLTNETNKYQLLPANSGIENASLSTQLNEYNTKLLERNSLVAHSSTKNPLVREMDKSLDAMRNALISSIDNQMVALRAQIRSLEAIGGKRPNMLRRCQLPARPFPQGNSTLSLQISACRTGTAPPCWNG